MKVAAGETNKTLITIILIAVVAGVGIILVPIMMKQFTNRNCCEQNGGIVVDNMCYDASTCTIGSDGNIDCRSGKSISDACKTESDDCPQYGPIPIECDNIGDLFDDLL